MRKLRLLLTGVVSTFTGLSASQAGEKIMPSDNVTAMVSKWAAAEREVCQSVLKYSELEELNAQDIYDYQLLLKMVSQISEEPIEYCETLLMENMHFGKPTRK